MPKTEKRDLLIHFDEDRQLLVFYSAPLRDTAAIRSTAFDGVRTEVSVFREMEPADAERELGRMAFSALDLFALERIGIRDYAAEAEASHAEYVSDLEARASQNDPEAQYFLFIEFHSRALRTRQESDLIEAERLLNASADGGYADAKLRLESDWPLLKHAAEKRIKRGPAA